MKAGQWEELEEGVGSSARTLQETKLGASTAETTSSWIEEKGGGLQRVDGDPVEEEEEEEGEREVGDRDPTGHHLLSHHHLPDDTGQ